MTATRTSRGGNREATTECRVFAVSSQRLWDGFFWAARVLFIWFIMLGLPLVYKKRLADHSWNSVERLALQQLEPRARTSRAGGAAVHVLDESELQVSKRFIKRCVLEWRVFATTINVVILSLAITLLPLLNGQLFTRTLLYSTFPCGLVGLVIGNVYSIHLEHIQDTQECSLWLSHASRNDMFIKFHVFLALPLTWSVWGLILLTMSLASYIWTYPGDLTIPSMGDVNMESILETWRVWWIALPSALLMVGLWNLWLLWLIFAQLANSETNAPTIQVPVSSTEDAISEHAESCIL